MSDLRSRNQEILEEKQGPPTAPSHPRKTSSRQYAAPAPPDRHAVDTAERHRQMRRHGPLRDLAPGRLGRSLARNLIKNAAHLALERPVRDRRQEGLLACKDSEHLGVGLFRRAPRLGRGCSSAWSVVTSRRGRVCRLSLYDQFPSTGTSRHEPEQRLYDQFQGPVFLGREAPEQCSPRARSARTEF